MSSNAHIRLQRGSVTALSQGMINPLVSTVARRRREDFTAMDELPPLPPRRRNIVFWWLSRIAGLLALLCVLLGVMADLTDRNIGLASVTWMILGLYVLGVQIYFLMAYFVETGGLD